MVELVPNKSFLELSLVSKAIGQAHIELLESQGKSGLGEWSSGRSISKPSKDPKFHLSLQRASPVSTEDQREPVMKPVPDSTETLGSTNETPMSKTHPEVEEGGASGSSISSSIPTTNEGDDEDFKKLSALTKEGGTGTKRTHMVGAAFDRLKPRSFSDGSKRLCLDERGCGSGTGLTSSSASPSCSNLGTESRDWCSESKKSKKFQKEYGKLRHLVPALSERDDLSKASSTNRLDLII